MVPVCLTDLQEYFSLSLLYDQTGLSMSQSSQRENVSELSKLWCVSSARADWLIAAYHSNLSGTLIMEMAKWMREPMAYSVPTKHSSSTELTLIWLYFWTALLSEFSSSLVSTSNFSLNRLNQAKKGRQWQSKLTHHFHQRRPTTGCTLLVSQQTHSALAFLFSILLTSKIRDGAAFLTIRYNITLLPSVNTLTARGMICGAKYTHHTFTPIIKHLITTTANKHSGKKSLIDNNMRKSHWHQAVRITSNKTAIR